MWSIWEIMITKFWGYMKRETLLPALLIGLSEQGFLLRQIQ